MSTMDAPRIESQIGAGRLARFTPPWRVWCDACGTVYLCSCYADALEWQAFHPWACPDQTTPPANELGPCVCTHGPEDHAYLSQSGERWACERCDCDEYREDYGGQADYTPPPAEPAPAVVPEPDPEPWPVGAWIAVALAGLCAVNLLLAFITSPMWAPQDPTSVLALVHRTAWRMAEGWFLVLALYAMWALWRGPHHGG